MRTRTIAYHWAARVAVGLLYAALLLGAGVSVAQEPSREVVADLSRKGKEQFLRHAEILEMREVGIGFSLGG